MDVRLAPIEADPRKDCGSATHGAIRWYYLVLLLCKNMKKKPAGRILEDTAMTINTDQLLESILDSLDRIDYVKSEDIPDIQLYMDQVTTFMDSQLAASKRHDDDKILTKTMINNYAKNNLLPPPEKKKYTKEHVLVLIFIYYLKSILSISDIQGILNPITEKYFGNDENYSLEDIYKEVFSLEHPETQNLMKDLAKKFNTSMNTFPDASEDEADLLHTFSFICMLSYDVYIKKTLIEKMIDQMASKNPETKPSKK